MAAYLDRFELHPLVHAVIARQFGHPELMKPNPDALDRALVLLDQPPQACVHVGDSVIDIEAARTAKVRSIGFAKNPRRAHELQAAQADATVTTMHALAEPINAASG